MWRHFTAKINKELNKKELEIVKRNIQKHGRFAC